MYAYFFLMPNAQISSACLSSVKDNFLFAPSINFIFPAVDTCPALPHLHNGRNIQVQNSAGSAYHFKCKKGYKRYGVRNTHCDGETWSHGDNWPICTSKLFGSQLIMRDIMSHSHLFNIKHFVSLSYICICQVFINIIVFQAETKHDFDDFKIRR